MRSRRILRCLVLMLVAGSGSSGVVLARAGQALAAIHPDGEAGVHPWDSPARELAGKIAARLDSSAPILLTVRNISSLGVDEAAEVRRALRTELRRAGLRLAIPQRAGLAELAGRAGGKKREPGRVLVTLSENSQGYLWVAEIARAAERNAASDVAMVEVAPSREEPARSRVGLVIRKMLLWEQDEPVLDAAAVDISVPCVASTPPCFTSGWLVLEPSKLSLTVPRTAGTASAQANTTGVMPSSPEQSAPLLHSKPWPRDLRGRLLVWPDHSLRSAQGRLFEAYLPGVTCHGQVAPALTVDCQDLDEPWPLGPQQQAASIAVLRAAYAAGRNFFDGRLVLTNGEERQVPPFFSGAALPANGSALWILEGVDGHARVFGNTYQAIETFSGLGSDIASVKSGCGSDSLILADAASESAEPDSVRAYEIARREAVAVSPAVEFAGPITALWPAADGDSAVAVSRNLETGKYEAYRLSVSCSQ